MRRFVTPAVPCFLALLAAALPAEAQSLTRGPYLQRGGSTGVVVRWRTSSATDSVVRYGTAPGSLTQTASDAASATEHVVGLWGLAPDTKYYYSVGSSSAAVAGGDANHFFVTAPPTGTAKPTRVWVIGDAGTKNSNQRAVRDAYYAFAGATHTDLWLMLGDNAYSTGTDSEYQQAVYDMYPTLLRKSVVWPTLGNHDGQTADSPTQSGPYYDMFTLPRNAEAGGTPSGTEAYYSFDYGNIHFVCLDSYDTSRATTGAMANWLRNDLASTAQTWIIAFWHHPPYTKGSHDSDSSSLLTQMRTNFLPILEDAGVDLVLTGHSHSYERSFLIDGHYGYSNTFTDAHKKAPGSGRDPAAYAKDPGAAHAGAVYVVAGSSGQTSGGSLDHPAMYISLNNLGSVALDVNGNRLDFKFIRETGAIGDYFSIVKGPAGDATPPTIEITAPSTAGAYAADATPLALGGTASDAVGVTQVTWSNAATGGSGTASGTASWTASVPLAAGSNAITVTARDAAGNTATDSITVTYAAPDSTAPVVTITSPTTASSDVTPATPVALGGTASDSVGVTEVTWSNAATGGSGTASGTTSWTASVALAAGPNAITVTARDAAGNSASDSLTITYYTSDSTPPAISILTPTASSQTGATSTPITLGGTASDDAAVAEVTWTNAATGGAGTAGGTTSWTATIPLAAGPNLITVTARDGASNEATDSITVTYSPPAGDSTAPVVTIQGPTPDASHAATSSQLVVSGGASDDQSLATVTWTNAATGASGTADGTSTWSAAIDLAAGSNLITIRAFDAHGNSGTDTLAVTFASGAAPSADNPNGDQSANDRCPVGAIGPAGAGLAWLAALSLLVFFLRRRPVILDS